MRYLKAINKKIAAAAILGSGIIAAAYFFSNGSLPKGIYKNENNINTAAVTLNSLIGNDSDLDGVKDWEEALWGTDPAKKDSDGNGVPDSTEIERRKSALGTTTSTENGDTVINETENLAREIFAATISLKQSGQLDQAAAENLSQALLSNIKPGEGENLYTESSFLIAPVSKENTSLYGTTVKTLFQKYVSLGIGRELAILEQALSKNQPESLLQLKSYSKLYENLAGEMAGILVPKDIVETHISLANDYHNLSASTKKLESFFENPVLGFTILIEYNKWISEVLENSKKISDYINNNDILLSK